MRVRLVMVINPTWENLWIAKHNISEVFNPLRGANRTD